MSTRWRPITAAVLLLSYMLASAGSWLHSASRYRGSSGAAEIAAAAGTPLCGCGHHGSNPLLGTAGAESADAASQVRQDGPLSSPHHEDCTVCRFQLTKKLAESASLAAILSDDCPEPLVLEAPLDRVAPLLTTPESRAPPMPV